MGLFATLGSAGSGSGRPTGASSLSLPTVIQLYTKDDRPFRFLVGSPTVNIPTYSHLTYQAVPATALNDAESSSFSAAALSAVVANNKAGLRLQGRNAAAHQNYLLMAAPDLGVWNCCISKPFSNKGSTTALSSTKSPSKKDSGGEEAAGGGAAATTSSSEKSKKGDSSSDNDGNLSDVLLRIPNAEEASTFCFTVDLSDLTTVEPSMTLMQEALIRYLIDRSLASAGAPSSSMNDSGPDVDDDDDKDESRKKKKNATTTLYQLRSVPFGLAANDKDKERSKTAAPDVSDKGITVALQICARLPSKSNNASSVVDGGATPTSPGPSTPTSKAGGAGPSSGGPAAVTSNSVDAGGGGAVAASPGGVGGETEDYQYKQEFAVIYYHLRRFAAAMNATLVFVREGPNVRRGAGGMVMSTDVVTSTTGSVGESGTGAGLPSDESKGTPSATGLDGSSSSQPQEQPALTSAQLAYVWKEMALGKEVWTDKESTEMIHKGQKPPEDSVHAIIYGPDNHNEELIESVLLRNANYPGHWDASKESVWKILPPSARSSPEDDPATSSSSVNGDGIYGDGHWLAKLRESISTGEATSSATSSSTPSKKSPAKTSSSSAAPSDDAGVSSFFQNLLK